MNVIEYLKDDEDMIERRLKTLVENFPEWPMERSFEETKKILNALGIHLRDKETLLVNNLKDSDGAEPVIEKSLNERKAIDDEIDNITQLHVDEVGFREGLKKLLIRVEGHNKFCEEEFFPEMTNRLTSDDLTHIQQQLDQMVMS